MKSTKKKSEPHYEITELERLKLDILNLDEQIKILRSKTVVTNDLYARISAIEHRPEVSHDCRTRFQITSALNKIRRLIGIENIEVVRNLEELLDEVLPK